MTPKEKAAYQKWQETCKRIRNRTAAPLNESTKAQNQRVKRLLKPGNFEGFCEYYFPHYLDSKFGWFHKLAAKKLTGSDNLFLVLEWAREHAKSVMADVFFPAYLLADGWLTGMILASENEDKAKVLLKDLEAELRNNQRFINDFGPFHVSGSWLNSYFTAGDGIGFWAFGLGQNPAGTRESEKRPNYGVVDDADSKRKSKNQVRILEDVDWVLGEFMGCLSIKEKRLVYTNNRVAGDGLTAHIVGDLDDDTPKRAGIEHIKVYATEDQRHNMLLPSDGGKPAWKERYTLEHIEKRMQEMGMRNAMRQFYHQHTEGEFVFTSEMIQWAQPRDWREYDAIVAYCDPSFSTSPTADYTAIKWWGQKGLTRHCLKAYVRQRESIEKAMEFWYDFYASIPPELQGKIRNIIEAEGMQKQLVKSALKGASEKYGFWMPVRFDSQSEKTNKQDRIADMVSEYENGLIYYSLEQQGNEDMKQGLKQLKEWHEKSSIDDSPDADQGAWSHLNKKSRSGNGKRTTGRYRKPIKRKV